MEVALPGFEHAPQLPQAQKWGLDTPGPRNHCTVHYLKLIALKYFSLPFTLFEPCGSAVCIMNSKIHVRKNSLNKYFKVISHYFHVYPYSQALYGPLKLNALVFFFAALAEVQVTIHFVLNLPLQGVSATCPIGRCCVCSLLLFASEILCDLPTYSKQRMNKITPSQWPCCLETQNAQWNHAECRL